MPGLLQVEDQTQSGKFDKRPQIYLLAQNAYLNFDARFDLKHSKNEICLLFGKQ